MIVCGFSFPITILYRTVRKSAWEMRVYVKNLARKRVQWPPRGARPMDYSRILHMEFHGDDVFLSFSREILLSKSPWNLKQEFLWSQRRQRDATRFEVFISFFLETNEKSPPREIWCPLAWWWRNQVEHLVKKTFYWFKFIATETLSWCAFTRTRLRWKNFAAECCKKKFFSISRTKKVGRQQLQWEHFDYVYD